MRKGDWILTFTGRRFYPLDPRPEDVCLEDIAHALSLICRYNGHSRFFYSVAEHFPEKIRPWPPEVAKNMFLERAEVLGIK